MPSLKVELLLKFRKRNKNDTGTPIVAWLAKICNFDRTFIKFCLYKYMMPYMTERIQ